jgi:hypothetical protein
MSTINFFCHCCGNKPEYSLDYAERLLETISWFYMVDPEHVRLKHKRGKYIARARKMVLYFLRHTTGESYKVIGEIFKLSAAAAASLTLRLESYLSRDAYQEDIEALQKLIISTLSTRNPPAHGTQQV